jgi:hypothetical protein
MSVTHHTIPAIVGMAGRQRGEKMQDAQDFGYRYVDSAGWLHRTQAEADAATADALAAGERDDNTVRPCDDPPLAILPAHDDVPMQAAE